MIAQKIISFMQKKNVLIVCKSFYPEINPRAFRATELAKEFAIQGHKVVVVTSTDPALIKLKDIYNIQFVYLGKTRWKTLNFGKSKLGFFLTRVVNRFLQLSIEYPDIEFFFKIIKTLKKLNGFDLLISIAVPYPIHWGVAFVWEKNNKISTTWVADCGDPYMGDRTDSFRKWFYFKYVEKWFMRKADWIAITVESFKINYYNEFHDKIVEIPQGFKFEDVVLSSRNEKNDYPTFAFAGSFIPGIRDPSLFLDYIVRKKEPFQFHVFTKNMEMIQCYANRSNDRIHLHEFIPRLELIKFLSEMDFLVNFEFDPAVQSPSKLIDYGLAKRPILNITSKDFRTQEIEDFFKGDYDKQFIVPDFSKYRIENVILRFLLLCK